MEGADSASSDFEVLILANDLVHEALYSSLAQVEASLDCNVNPTLHTQKGYQNRRPADNLFLTRVIAGEHVVLMGGDVD